MSLPIDLRKNERGAAVVVIAVLALVLGGFVTLGLRYFDVREDPDYEKETRLKIERLADHLAAYVHNHWRLPCPADPRVSRNSIGFGAENRDNPYSSDPKTLDTPEGDHEPNEMGCREINGVTTIAVNGVNGSYEGIFPFRELGLSEHDVKDGWGNYFTYAVSPVFATINTHYERDMRRTDIRAGGDPLAGIPYFNVVHNACRVEEVWVGNDSFNTITMVADVGDRNYNPKKARFCCPGEGSLAGADENDFALTDTDIKILDANGDRIPPFTVPPADVGDVENRSSDTDAYGDLYDVGGGISITLSDIPDESKTPVAFAFVLISHGPNGAGAFIATSNPGGAAVRNRIVTPLPSGSPNLEFENANDDGGNPVFNDLPRVMVEGADNYFDDIVLYRTQHEVVAELNNATCLRPFR